MRKCYFYRQDVTGLGCVTESVLLLLRLNITLYSHQSTIITRISITITDLVSRSVQQRTKVLGGGLFAKPKQSIVGYDRLLWIQHQHPFVRVQIQLPDLSVY